MYLYWWVVFSLNVLLSAGIMITYLGRRDHNDEIRSLQENPGPRLKTLVILPAKGVDYDLDKNIASLQNQEYNPYDLVAVVDIENDQSVPILKKAGIAHDISNATCVGCSGKVRAIYSAILDHPDYEYYVVADSDIRVQSSWLANLTSPLSDPCIGVSTTFPVFYPEGGFWSKFKMFWGLVGQSMMESNLTRFVWGGSMAFRKELLDDKSLESFSRSVSDDIAILRIARGKGLKISYVPESRPMIHSNDNFQTFMEWSNRQTAFSIYSTRRTFAFGLIYYLVSIYLLVSSIILSIFVNPLFLSFLFPYLFNSFNSQKKAPVKVWYFLFLTFILPFIYIWNLASGMSRKRVNWRGTTYSLSRDE